MWLVVFFCRCFFRFGRVCILLALCFRNQCSYDFLHFLCVILYLLFYGLAYGCSKATLSIRVIVTLLHFEASLASSQQIIQKMAFLGATRFRIQFQRTC